MNFTKTYCRYNIFKKKTIVNISTMSTTNSESNKFAIKFNKNNVQSTDLKRISDTGRNGLNTRNTSKGQPANDDILTRMAVEEIVNETAKGAIRAEQVGPSGWRPCPLKTNKRFLRNTIKSVISHNRNKGDIPKKSEAELDEIIKRGQRRTAKFGDRKHCFRRPNVDRGEKQNT